MHHHPLFLFAALILAPASVHASLALQPIGASTDMGSATPAFVPDNVINQSGLSVGYTSLVTDFDAYIGANPTHDSIAGDSDIWLSAAGVPTGNFDFDLGGTFTVQALALWNLGGNDPSNVVQFTLLAADDPSFSSPQTLGVFTASAAGGNTAVPPQLFPFAPTEAAFVRMQITDNNGSIATGFGEAVFEAHQTPVPEPSALTVFATITAMACGVGIIWRRRKPSA
jgi:hypothetical protein